MTKYALLTIMLGGLGAVPARAEETVAPEHHDVPGAAHAPEIAPTAASSDYPDEYTLRPLTLKRGMAELVAPVMVDLTRDRAGSPVQVMPELGYGVTDRLELRILHDRGLCFKGEKINSDGSSDDRCDGKLYSGLGLVAHYSLLRNVPLQLGRNSVGIHLAGQGGLIVKDVDPNMMALRLGMQLKLVVPRFISAPLSVYLAPTVDIGLNRRDAGNKDYINVSEIIAFQATRRIAPFMLTGIKGPVRGFGSNYDVPLGVGLNILLFHGLDVGAELVLPRFMSGYSGGGTGDRFVLGYVTLRTVVLDVMAPEGSGHTTVVPRPGAVTEATVELTRHLGE